MQLIVANWKNYLSLSAAREWCAHSQELASSAKIIVCPDAATLGTLAAATPDISFGAQSCAPESAGAYTGQVSATTFADLGCTHVLIGHAEMRRWCGETDALVALRAASAQAAGLVPIICVGESAEERATGATKKIVLRQLEAVTNLKNFWIAYEPLWAIGSGTPIDLQELKPMVACIKECAGPGLQGVLYGGSVDENISRLLQESGIVDGLLVGKASIDFQKFKKIVSCW